MAHSNIPSRVHSPWARAESALQIGDERAFAVTGSDMPSCLGCALGGEIVVLFCCRASSVLGACLKRKRQASWGHCSGTVAGCMTGRQGIDGAAPLQPLKPHRLVGRLAVWGNGEPPALASSPRPSSSSSWSCGSKTNSFIKQLRARQSKHQTAICLFPRTIVI